MQELYLLGHQQGADLRGEAFDEILVRKHSGPMCAPVGVIIELSEMYKLIDSAGIAHASCPARFEQRGASAYSTALRMVSLPAADFTTGPSNLGVIISDDLPSKRRRFLIVENRHERYVHVCVPLSDISLHGGNVVRFKNRNTGACCWIAPAANDLYSFASIRSLLRRHRGPPLAERQPFFLLNAPASHKLHRTLPMLLRLMPIP
jgi:hypothetical protein